MDIEAVRAFVAVVEVGQFQAAADELGISQQAVSKRIVGLERNLGASLLVRTSRGSRLSLDGQVFLPHARKVVAAIEQAEQAVRPGSRPLRVDVLNRRIAPAQAVSRFYRSRPDTARTPRAAFSPPSGPPPQALPRRGRPKRDSAGATTGRRM